MNRLGIALISAAILALPTGAQAAGFGRGSHHSSSSSSSSSSGGHEAHPANSGHRAYAVGSSADDYRGGYSGGGHIYSHPGYWAWGIHPWGYYGYGYYPYVGGPELVVASEPAPEPPSITAGVFLGGMVSRADSRGQGALDLKLQVDGKRLGLDLDVLTLPSGDPGDSFDITAMPMVKGDLTYSLVSDLHTRVRVEGGVQGIAAPGVTYIGPDIGVSGQIAIFGPIEVEGSAHLMPVPAYVWDLQTAVGLNFGALALRGGWRWVRLDDSNRCSDVGVSCGVDIYSGPQVSVGLVF